jgi:Na+/H+ antiporter NhaD/arsenite permease-like protein
MNAMSNAPCVNPAMMLPFGTLLAAIALAPLFFSDWWGRHYPKIVGLLALAVVVYYFAGLHDGGRVGRTAREYFSFVALVGSLFVVSGGIHINVKGQATPKANVLFLLVGALAANLLGTTGASMLLIRPWLRMNKYRITGLHVMFFIFIVSNVGGCLTPVGDPPLFLGYLMGVPFWWVAAHGFLIWAVGVGTLLLMFYAVDSYNYQRASKTVRLEETQAGEQWRFDGLINILFLAVILAAVFIQEPPFLREGLMLAAAAASYFTTPKPVHESNHFNLQPIKEVAILFIGIFATMMPALDWLQANAGRINSPSMAFFYAGSGCLSSVLDNAPTYLCFLQAVCGRFIHPDSTAQLSQLLHTHGAGLAAVTGAHAQEIRGAFAALRQFHPATLASGFASTDQIQVAYLVGNQNLGAYILAVSIGSVFFGANTYIGNGPNFMVKAIADHQKVHTPSFLAYIFKYTLPFMLPMLLLVWWLFFQ